MHIFDLVFCCLVPPVICHTAVPAMQAVQCPDGTAYEWNYQEEGNGLVPRPKPGCDSNGCCRTPNAPSKLGCERTSIPGSGCGQGSTWVWLARNGSPYQACVLDCPAHTHQANGGQCFHPCPSGWRDDLIDSLICYKPEASGRGVGYPVWEWDKCNREHPQGCESYGLWPFQTHYPRCGPGFAPLGCCLCQAVCPAGTTEYDVARCKKNMVRDRQVVSESPPCPAAFPEPCDLFCTRQGGCAKWREQQAVGLIFQALLPGRPTSTVRVNPNSGSIWNAYRNLYSGACYDVHKTRPWFSFSLGRWLSNVWVVRCSVG